MVIRKTVSFNQIELSYLDWQTDGEPVLLLHGLADHALGWSAVGEHIAQHYHPVAVDMRGHGQSSKPNDGYDFDTVMGDLVQLMEHLGWSAAHIVGHSWSGKVATYWATRQPEHFLTMVLVDPIFVYGMPGIFRLTFPLFYGILPFLKGMGPFADWDAAIQQGKQMKQYRDWNSLQEAVFRESLAENPDGTMGSKFTKAARDEIFDAVLRVPGLTQEIQVPSLFMQPQAGVNRFDWQLKPYRKYLKNLRVETIPGNHWAFLVEPENFSKTLIDFLA
ncbi:alpha/beta hydrolase [Leptolyngbyaceae cyanobacterium CCMR0082]|uniref:Alpha/beta hydrolase n=1 Tax=Adonisia turfae CCMR0082 TaxID=2304604 RepID=A0A6M0S9F7_9CYAN|nr:alpha/beta hydrolase [Adonisia turfae]MDV3352099.1 alpha/beta hydrolase [Leptothoe sp. LEGE 181152]NEZ65115.1 alpha/beta hydrolase [Adonisia turfae CCMR0082]